MRRRPNEKLFALYKGEELIADGTLKEISAKLGVKIETLRFYKSPAYKKRIRGENARILVCIDEEEEDG